MLLEQHDRTLSMRRLLAPSGCTRAVLPLCASYAPVRSGRILRPWTERLGRAQTAVSMPVVVAGESFLDALFASVSQD